MVYGSALEKRRAQAPWVRIPPSPPLAPGVAAVAAVEAADPIRRGRGAEVGVSTHQETPSPMTAQASATSALPIPAETAAAIPAERSRSLRRWNRFLTFAHGIQFVIMIAISSTAVLFEPVVPTVKPIFTDGKFSGTEPSSVVLFSIPLAYLIASFFLMSAIAHFARRLAPAGPLRGVAGARH